MHVGSLCWEPGGCSSDQTIVRLNVDTGVVWCFLSSLLRSLWTSISSPVCHLRGTVYFDSPHCWKHRCNTIIHYKPSTSCISVNCMRPSSSGRIFPFQQTTAFEQQVTHFAPCKSCAIRSFLNSVAASHCGVKRKGSRAHCTLSPDDHLVSLSTTSPHPEQCCLLVTFRRFQHPDTASFCPSVAVHALPPILAHVKDLVCFGKKQHVASSARQAAVTLQPGAPPSIASLPRYRSHAVVH